MVVEGDQSSVLKNSKNTKLEQEHEFLGRKRESGRRDASMGCMWAPGGCVAWPGAGSRHLASWARGGPPGQPQVSPSGFLPGNFYFEFSGIFRTTSL